MLNRFAAQLRRRTGLRPLSDPDSESVVDPGEANVAAEPPGSELDPGPELDPGSNPNPNPAMPGSAWLRSELAESVRDAWCTPACSLNK